MENLYYLKNTYGEYQEYTKDTNKIKLIYIDECNQSLRNNIDFNNLLDYNGHKESLQYIEKWSKEIEKCLCNQYTITEIIERLNKEHQWAIEVYERKF